MPKHLFKKGQPRPPGQGRKKGQKSLKSLLKASDIFLQRGLNPVEMILDLLPKVSPEEQIKTLIALHEYVEIKPRTYNLTVQPQTPPPQAQEALSLPRDVTPELLLEAQKQEDSQAEQLQDEQNENNES